MPFSNYNWVVQFAHRNYIISQYPNAPNALRAWKQMLQKPTCEAQFRRRRLGPPGRTGCLQVLSTGWMVAYIMGLNDDLMGFNGGFNGNMMGIMTGWWWLEHDFYMFPYELGMSSSQLTNSYFSEGLKPPSLLLQKGLYREDISNLWIHHSQLHISHRA